ncbi:MAG: hypothetical protein R2688_06355 [Fimbriimonadaceae bacterium]
MKERDLIQHLAQFIPELSGNTTLSGFSTRLDSGTGQSVELILPTPAGFDHLPAEELGLHRPQRPRSDRCGMGDAPTGQPSRR